MSGEGIQFLLPVSNLEVLLRERTGVEDLLIVEARGGETQLALVLASSLARDMDGNRIDWVELPATDLDVFLLNLRRAWIGNQVRVDVRCDNQDCRERIDMSFTVDQYLAHQSAAKDDLQEALQNISEPDENGWRQLTNEEEGSSIEFRLPTPSDQLAIAFEADPAFEMRRRCVRPPDLSAKLTSHAEVAIEKLSPCFSGDLNGVCPVCGTAVNAYFDARGYCLSELRNSAAFIYEDIDLLARRYHWHEKDILALPYSRRSIYAELARSGEAS